MKSTFVNFAAIVFISLSVVACKDAKNKTEAKAAAEETAVGSESVKYNADAETAKIEWKGSKLAGTHHGTIKISEGFFAMNDGKLSGGTFIVDMNSIENLDLEDKEYNDKLVNHLKSDDFFSVANHPNAVFTITEITEKEGKTIVNGNLTLRDVKKNISFPTNVKVNGDKLTLTSEPFTIDRTDWGIEFKSGKFTDLAKDKLIDDNIELQVELTADKA